MILVALKIIERCRWVTFLFFEKSRLRSKPCIDHIVHLGPFQNHTIHWKMVLFVADIDDCTGAFSIEWFLLSNLSSRFSLVVILTPGKLEETTTSFSIHKTEYLYFVKNGETCRLICPPWCARRVKLLKIPLLFSKIQNVVFVVSSMADEGASHFLDSIKDLREYCHNPKVGLRSRVSYLGFTQIYWSCRHSRVVFTQTYSFIIARWSLMWYICDLSSFKPITRWFYTEQWEMC